MLPPACRWIISDDGNAYLHWHFGCIAVVRRDGDRYRTEIRWSGRELIGAAGSREQGIRFVSRWVSKRHGFPNARNDRLQ